MVFDGEELLEFAVKSIRNVIDYISVTYQDVSYFGNKADPNLLSYLENGLMWVGQIKKSCGSNGYCTDFDLYEDLQMEKDEIIICVGNQTSVLKIFNYPFVE